jgi:recombinational DNA repair ATPase RecF
MTEPFVLERLTLTAFRAYLTPAVFDFSSKRSLAVFAPNGKGKSSIVDGLEFMFSKDGTLLRLGTRTIHNRAGLAALAHNRAAEKGVEPAVFVRFRKGNQRPDGTRRASGTQRPRPEVADDVATQFVVDPIVRGYELRQFVECVPAWKKDPLSGVIGA